MFNTLIISGGAMKGVGMLAILHKQKIVNVNKLTTYIGTSVGAIMCSFFTLGYTPIEVFFIVLSICPIEMIHRQKVKDIINKYFDKNFKELYEQTKKRLIIPVYDLKKRTAVYYSYELTPEKSVAEALKETMNLSPFESIMDGCVCEPFPVKYCKSKGFGPIFGIYCHTKMNDTEKISTWVENVYSCFTYLQEKLKNYELLFLENDDKTLCFNNDPSANSVYELTFENAPQMFMEAYTTFQMP
jgi:predicted acylesterase/phospholipase RssA